jgi:hypothetical protein
MNADEEGLLEILKNLSREHLPRVSHQIIVSSKHLYA